MKSMGKWIIVLIGILTLTGCIESNTVIKVNLDGSGEVEETFLMGTEMIQMILGFAALSGEEDPTRELITLIVENEEAFRKLALSKTESLEETKQVIAALPGIKVGRTERQGRSTV